MGKIKKVDQKKEVFADVLNLLRAAFRYSYLSMQTQVLQHYPPSSVFLAAINMKIPKVFFYMQKNLKIILSLMLRLSQSVITTICTKRNVFYLYFLTIFFFHPSKKKKNINICICIILCFL